MTAFLVTHIECTGETGAEPLHRFRQVGVPCLQQEVVMVEHQDIDVYFNGKTLRQLSQKGDEILPVLIRMKK